MGVVWLVPRNIARATIRPGQISNPISRKPRPGGRRIMILIWAKKTPRCGGKKGLLLGQICDPTADAAVSMFWRRACPFFERGPRASELEVKIVPPNFALRFAPHTTDPASISSGPYCRCHPVASANCCLPVSLAGVGAQAFINATHAFPNNVDIRVYL